MSRRPGLLGLSDHPTSAASYASHGLAYRTQHSASLKTQLDVFRSLLYQFSIAHKADIQKNPQFRAEFARMCAAIGVDPLASSHLRSGSSGGAGNSSGSDGKAAGGKEGNSIWAQMLGGSVNDFYFGLAVRVVEECRATRAENGGMMALEDVRRRVSAKGRFGDTIDVDKSEMEISEDDVVRAVKSLEPLGSGFKIVTLGHTKMIRSVPRELNIDQSKVLEILHILGFVTVSMLQVNLGWEAPRAMAVIEDLISESLVWVDQQAGEAEYWSPSAITMHIGKVT